MGIGNLMGQVVKKLLTKNLKLRTVKEKGILALFLVFFSLSAQPVDAGALIPVGGMSKPSFMNTGPSLSAHSYQAIYGAWVSNEIIDRFEIEWGVLYAPRGYLNKAIGRELTFKSLQFPLVFRLLLGPHLSLGAGAYFSHGMGSVSLTDPTGESTAGYVSYPDASLSRDDHGALLSLQFRASLGPVMGLLLDARYLYGLRNINLSPGGASISMADLQIFLGLRIGD